MVITPEQIKAMLEEIDECSRGMNDRKWDDDDPEYIRYLKRGSYLQSIVGEWLDTEGNEAPDLVGVMFTHYNYNITI